MEYIVYAQVNQNGVITALNSSFFVDDDWGIEIDRGSGDRYAHAQNNYLPGGVMDEDGRYAYKLVNGQVVERTEEEKANDEN